MSIDGITPPERPEPSAEKPSGSSGGADELIQQERPWGETIGLRVQASDLHGVRVPAEETTPRMDSYADQATQPLVDFSEMTPDKITQAEPLIGEEFGSGSAQAQAVGRELADRYRAAPSSRVSIGQTRAVAADLNARGLSQDDAITVWKTFYDEALEAHGRSYQYANGNVVITARDAGFKDVIVIDPHGISAPGSTTSHNVLAGALGPVSPRLPGPDRSAG